MYQMHNAAAAFGRPRAALVMNPGIVVLYFVQFGWATGRSRPVETAVWILRLDFQRVSIVQIGGLARGG